MVLPPGWTASGFLSLGITLLVYRWWVETLLAPDLVMGEFCFLGIALWAGRVIMSADWSHCFP